MNLIEQLGGYEEANIFLKKRELHLDRNDYPSNSVGKIKKALTELKTELLNYRRAHNIYEVGDLVTHPVFWGLFEIKEVMNHHIVGVTPTRYESKLAIQIIKHATPEEIKAGRRL